MKRNIKDCNHSGAIPWIGFPYGGFMWCSDCGAMRTLRTKSPNSFTWASNHWLYPTGRDDVIKQMEKCREV